jgi:hypothetical protein
MQCDEVIRELAVPTDDRDSAALAEHLTGCRSCANWAKRAAQLDLLWEATHPTELSHETWAAVWANLAATLDSSTPADVETLPLFAPSSNGSVAGVELPLVPNHTSSRFRRSTFAAMALLGLGQAAAVILAVSLTWRPSATSRSPQIANRSTPVPRLSASPTVAQPDLTLSSPKVEIEEGRLVVIRVQGPAAKVVDLTPEGISWSVDDLYVMFNAVESMSNSEVAMKE